MPKKPLTQLQHFTKLLQNPRMHLRAQLYVMIMAKYKPLEDATQNDTLYDVAENILCSELLKQLYIQMGLTGDNPDETNDIYDAFEQYILNNVAPSF